MKDLIDLTAMSSDDELDIMTASTSTLVSPTPPSVLYDDRSNSLRLSNRTSSTAADSGTKRKRKLVDSTRADSASKKAKKDDKSTVIIVLNKKKVVAEASRRRWLHQHRDLFIPLLPKSSNYFDNLTADIKRDKGVYIPLHNIDVQPSLITGGSMKDYQLTGLSYLAWMYKNGMNCILGDEMGLGKTLQTLSLFAYIKDSSKDAQDPHLIVCPLSVLSSWLSEATRWTPSLRVLRFHGQQSERDRLKNSIRLGEIKFDLCVTTYEAYSAEDSWFKTRRWTYCVLDEGHRVKNADTHISGKLQGIGSLYRLILTGTPVQNNLVELWGLLHWLYPQVFTDTSERLFKESFDLTRGTYSMSFLNAAQNLLSAIMLRRTKATVEISVPPREELTVFLPMAEAQRFWYYRLLTRMDSVELENIFNAKDEGEDGGCKEVQAYLASQVKRGKLGEQSEWKKLMNLLLQLRRVCDHPYILPDAEPSPWVNGEHLVATSSKLMMVDKILADLLPRGERVLIFTQWTAMLDLLEEHMDLRSIPYARLDGSTPRPRRSLDIKLFQKEKSPYQVYLISTKAGGLGINLTKASHVVMFDSDWNPQNDLQAIARAHRIGQTKIVKVYRLVCRGSVEDQMLDRIRRKLFLSLKVMDADNSTGEQNAALKKRELMDILRKGSSALSNSDDSMGFAEFSQASLEEVLEASRSRDNIRTAKIKKELDQRENVDQQLLEEALEEERELLKGVAQVHSRLFEGKVVRQQKDNKEIATEWQELQKRARYDRIVIVDGMEVIAANVGPIAPAVSKAPPKRTRKKFESEDWCIYCRDGGDLVLCTRCPRIFHPRCHGMSKAEVLRTANPSCSQHNCHTCSRNTGDAGGMLFRCQTCPNAFCEDCVPFDDIEAVGDTLPEFLLLGFEGHSSAYYIRCHECLEYFAKHPEEWEERLKEMEETQKKLDILDTST